MRFKYFVYLALTVFTFSLGVGLWSLRLHLVATSESHLNRLEPVRDAVYLGRTYQDHLHASGAVGRYPACFSHFSSSDGMHFSSTRIQFSSSRQAHNEVQKRLRKALTIVSRVNTMNDTGVVVGEQVVATFAPYKGLTEPSAHWISTSGSVFYSVTSSSLRNIEKYKKDH